MNIKFKFLLLLSLIMFFPAFVFSAQTLEEEETAVSREDLEGDLYIPAPLVQRSTMREVFGSRRGYFHPFLSVAESYSDNFFNTADDEEDEFITVISPGIWLAFPASQRQLLRTTTLNKAPGGLEVRRFRTDAIRPLQGYALYRADIEEHEHFSNEDRVNQRAEGLLRLGFRKRLSVEFMDVYELDNDPYSTGISEERQLDEFDSNLFNTLVAYRMGPRTRIQLSYSNYSLNYDSDRNAFRERADNAFAGAVFYSVFPKTSAFLEYEFIDIDYDEDLLSDSEEHHYFGGFLWDITARSRGHLKLGYGKKDFQGSGTTDHEDFIGEARLDHKFSRKTSVYLEATRKTSETDIQGTQDRLSHKVKVGYRQRLTPKLRGAADVYYLRDSYRGNIAGGGTDRRKDEYYGAGISLGYAITTWLNMGLGYNYTERDSNIADRNYRKNTVFLNVTAAL